MKKSLKDASLASLGLVTRSRTSIFLAMVNRVRVRVLRNLFITEEEEEQVFIVTTKGRYGLE